MRCPWGPRRLLMKLIQDGERPQLTDGNLLELACSDCKRTMRRSGDPVTQVLHRYNLLGEMIESVVLKDELD